MPFEKGKSGNPNGRGNSPNKVTTEIKEAFAKLLEDKGPEISQWMTRIAVEDPAKAMDLLIKISERFVPALSRTELTGGEGKDLFENIIVNFNTATKEEDGDTN